MRKLKFIIFASLLVGGAILCAVRWKAWFGNPPAPQWQGDTVTLSFRTLDDSLLLQRLQKDTLQLLVLGDVHNGLERADYFCICERHTDIDFYAQLGDWIERPCVYYEQMLYRAIENTGLDTLPVVAIPGNHEYHKGLIKRLSTSWKSRFANPQNGPARFLGSTYYVDFPHLRVIAIDTDGLQRLSDYTQTAFWLKQVLREATDRYTIVLMHHPIFSAAKGRQNPWMWLGFYGALREADVVFAGHDHGYMRRTQEYKERFWSRQQPTVFVVTNASDKVYPSKDRAVCGCSYTGEALYEHLIIAPDTMRVRTYKVGTNECIDSFSIAR